MELNSKGRFLGGQGKATVRDSNQTPEPVMGSSDYPYIVAPNSVTEVQANSADPGNIDEGHALNNIAGSHDYMPTDLNNGTIDLLNGAKIVEVLDPFGIPMIGLDKSEGTPAVKDIYVAANGAGGQLPANAPHQTTTPETVTVGGPADRKSTRLNSSHRCISYAVFCLKKKKKLE